MARSLSSTAPLAATSSGGTDIVGMIVGFFIFAIFASIFGYVAYRILERMTSYKSSLSLVALCVTLPRKQSQLDRQNEVARDMKETVAIMEQTLAAMASFTSHDRFPYKSNLSFEYIAQGNEIRFFIFCPRDARSIIENAISSYYSDAVLEEIDDYNIFTPDGAQSACVGQLADTDYKPLQTYMTLGVDPINSITNALTKFEKDENAAISFTLRPLSSTWGKPAHSYTQSRIAKAQNPGEGKTPIPLTEVEQERLKFIDEKANMLGYGVCLRVVTNAPTQQRADILMKQIQSAFTQFERPGLNKIVFKNKNRQHVIRNYIFKYFGRGKSVMQLSSQELASLFHLPNIVYNTTPNIKWQKFKLLSPPDNMPLKEHDSLYLGVNRFRGTETEVWMKPKDRFRHFYIIGQTGTGKSTLLTAMIKQDIAAGRGVLVMDPHGELAEGILAHVPKERADDVIYFDPGNLQRPMGLNLLEAKTADERERVALDATAMMIKLFGEEVFSARLQEYFQNAVLTLMEDEEDPGTLIDVVRMFTDEAYQQKKVAKCTNSTVLKWWQTTYAQMGDREKQEIIPYFSSKFNQFSTNMMMRNIVGQKHSAFNIKEAMDSNKIVLVNLSKGKLGDLNSSLIGMIIISKLQGAAMARTLIPEEERVPFYAYLDEFQNVVTDKIESILSEARKYKLSLTIAHQFLAQLDKVEEVKKAVFGNVGTMICYKIGAEDSEYMSKEFAPLVSDQDLVNIAVQTGVMKMSIDTQPSSPFTIHPDSPAAVYGGGNKKMQSALKKISSLKYGRDARFVQKEIDLRMKGA